MEGLAGKVWRRMKALKLRKFKKAVFWFITITLFFFTGCRVMEQEPENGDVLDEKQPAAEDTSENFPERFAAFQEEYEIQDSMSLNKTVKPMTVLGEFKTYYGDSPENRKINIENAVKKINHTILKPGEEFSCYKTLSPFTEENGYRPAGAYEAGKIVKSIGGGVCQISTTLYNAVLLAELKVSERAAHSMTVSYVELARDAAIAGDYKDLKFKNNQKDEVVIRTCAEDGWLIFQIEGIETRPALRSIALETVIISETEPGEDVVTVDKSMKRGEEKVTQEEHKGYKAELYKVVYENGREVERIKINTSNYEPSPRYVTQGE